jgi:hypothetical protein
MEIVDILNALETLYWFDHILYIAFRQHINTGFS